MSELKWRISPAGGITCQPDTLPAGVVHRDHIEMGGRAVNAIIEWEIGESGVLSVIRNVRWPTVRIAQDDTYGAFHFLFASSDDGRPDIDGTPYCASHVSTIAIDGFFSWEEADAGANITVLRTIFPSSSLPCLLERWRIHNTGPCERTVCIPRQAVDMPQSREQFHWTAHTVRREWIGSGTYTLAAGESLSAGIVFSCREENAPLLFPSLEAEWFGRTAFRDSLYAHLDLVTPDPVVDQLFRFSKLRAAENVVATRGGLMHGPGGYNRYLGALWCNDQNEYANPFFPFLGDAGGNESALNAYLWFASYQNEAFQPIPSSIVAEGRGAWEGAGDRGDAAMTACGAARWALANGDPQQARSLWPFIRWCLAYCERRRNEQGVIESDSDELEGRFSSGRTNLATSCLTFDALLSASCLARALDEPASMAAHYEDAAWALRASIESQFGATIDGYATYRYHENLDRLRAWICLPLAVGITERAAGTVAALLSKDLWTEEGLLTEAGTATRWDRSTLYALRGLFIAGFANDGLERLKTYAESRMLGNHVPYCIEAHPEANKSQLSAESALFCRIVTEGVCGIRPIGFSKFECTPQLPDSWPGLTLRNVRAFGRCWNLELIARSAGTEVVVTLAGGSEAYRAVGRNGDKHTVAL